MFVVARQVFNKSWTILMMMMTMRSPLLYAIVITTVVSLEPLQYVTVIKNCETLAYYHHAIKLSNKNL